MPASPTPTRARRSSNSRRRPAAAAAALAHGVAGADWAGRGRLFILAQLRAGRAWPRWLNAKWEWLLATLLVLWARDLGYIYRIRYIAERELSWSAGVRGDCRLGVCLVRAAFGGGRHGGGPDYSEQRRHSAG
ncbi:MAG: hypothetical protein WKG07_45450 [Hymenobacter sp.]